MKQTLMVMQLLLLLACFARNLDAEPVAFENYATFEAVALTPTAIQFQTAYAPGPFAWFNSSGAAELPGFDDSVTSTFFITVLGLPVIDEANMRLTVDAGFEQNFEARDADGTVTGTMTLVGVGKEAFDLNPETIEIDSDAGVIRRQFGSPFFDGEPVVRASLTEATGIFAGIEAVGEWEVHVSAVQVIPLVPEIPLIDNIIQFRSGVAPIATFGEAVTVGMFVPEPSSWLLAAIGLTLLAATGRKARHTRIAAVER